MEIKLILTSTQYKDLVDFCNLNDLLMSEVVKKSFTSGFNIEKYGLLNSSEKVVEKEVIKTVEIPVEKIVEVIREVPVEKVIEIIKEIPSPPTEIKVIEYVDREIIKEVEVEKIINIQDDTQIDELVKKTEELKKEKEELVLKIQQLEQREPQVVEKITTDDTKQKLLEQTLINLRTDNITKDKKIKELEEQILELNKLKQNMGAVFLRGSNLDETLYK